MSISRMMDWISDFWSEIADDPTDHDTVQDAVAEVTWLECAMPAISEVLTENRCWAADGDYTYTEWVDGVALLIAERIASDPVRAMDALSRYEVEE